MNIWKKLNNIIQEDILGNDNRYMAMAWLVCLSGLILLGFYLSSESRSFLGVADSREQQVSFEYPVSIKQLHVLSGQTVRKGDLMMELDQSELSEKIRLTRSQLSRLMSEKSLRAQLNLIVSNSTAGDLADPLSVDIEDLNEQLESLEEQRKNLYVFAQVDGVVGAVNFRRGEKVPAFTSILTLSPDSPTYVEGFLHESLRTKLEVGKTVTITPLSSSTQALEGKIVSVGSRIILIPPRLAHYPNMQVWGREVVVEIPPHNGLLLGEKVQIKPRMELITFSQATASAKEKNTKVLSPILDPQPLKFPADLAKRFAFEPSGAIYLEDLKKFLVISDDTDDKKSATLFLANTDGTIEEQVLTVPGVKKVSDLESISQQNGHIYLLTSQGTNKKGKDKKNRNQFIRVKRSGLSLSNTTVVDFKPLLMKAFLASRDERLQNIAKISSGEFEIEGHYVDGENLFLGLKGPLLNKQSALIKITSFETLFEKNVLSAEQVTLWQTILFENVEGMPHRLSELIQSEGKVYAATVCAEENCGAVWELRGQEREGPLRPVLIKFFKGVKPEGLAFDSHSRTLFVTFDEKNNTALFTKVDVK